MSIVCESYKLRLQCRFAAASIDLAAEIDAALCDRRSSAVKTIS